MNISLEPDIPKTSWRPFGLSLLFHSLLFLLLLVLINRLPGDPAGDNLRRGRLVLAINNVDQTTEYLTEESASDGSEAASEDAVSLPAAAATAPAIDMPNIPDLPGVAVVETFDVTNMANVPKNSAPPGEFSLSKEDLEMIAKEQRELKAQQPKGPPATIQVFGSGELKGQRFVFVIDRSKSMGSQGLGVLKRAVKELSSAINQLEDYHQFQIVAYHDRTITMSRRAMLPASEFNKQQAPDFIDNLIAFGGTSHDYGLYSALAFHPDIVVLMTDAGPPELHGGQLSEIKTMAVDTSKFTPSNSGEGPSR